MLVPDIVNIKAWAAKKPVGHFKDETIEELLKHEDVKHLLTSELVDVCGAFKSYERPLRWIAISEPFSQVRVKSER
jgi:hypothetical protein